MDNGWDPVDIYLEYPPFKPPSKVHSPGFSDSASTVRSSLNIEMTGYFSSSLVYLVWLLFALYAPVFDLSTPFFTLKQKTIRNQIHYVV